MELREGEEELIEQVIIIAEKLIESAKSKKISIKLRKLLRYAYVSYTMGIPVSVDNTEGWNKVRSIYVKLPARLTNKYYYREIERVLKERFNARVVKRRRTKYIVFYKGRAPPIRLATPARSVRQYAGQKYYF